MNLQQAITQIKLIRENLIRVTPKSETIVKFKRHSIEAIDIILKELEGNG